MKSLIPIPLILGHRGASHAAPQNTIEAFTLAGAMGADGIELDVHVSADGVLVVHHDADLAGLGLSKEFRFAEIREAHPSVPTLDEVFDACSGMQLINVEMKCCAWDPDADPQRAVARGVAELITRRNAYHQVSVSSFDLAMLDDFRAMDVRFETGWLTSGLDPVAGVTKTAQHGHAWYHPDWGNLSLQLVATMAAANDHGVRINTWTVDDVEVMQQFGAAGVHGIITNEPDRARAAFANG